MSITITPPAHRTIDDKNGPGLVIDVIVEIAIDDPDHDLVSARLLLAPPGFDMEPVVNAPTPFVRRFHWNAETMAGGRDYFLVEAHDNVVPDRIVRARGAVDLPGDGMDATTRWMDVDGDLQPELVAVVGDQPVGGIAGAGALAVYDRLVADERHVELGSTVRPSPTLSMANQPLAIRGGHPHWFHAASPTQDEHLGVVTSACPIQQADLNGDGILDLVALSAKNSGTLHVWFGGPLGIATRPADATLDAGPVANFGDAFFLVVRFRDLTGDGIEDVVVNAKYDGSIAPGAGAIHLFAGGPTLVGKVGPTATMRLAAPAAGDELGSEICFGDVTGDGVDDVVAVAYGATWNGLADHGLMAVFAGGGGLVGAVQPLAVFASTEPYKKFGSCEIPPLDVTGDSIPDVVVPVKNWNIYTGRICVWNGGPTLVGTPAESAILSDPTGVIRDSDALEVAVVDVTGDGVRDVVDLRPWADPAGIVDAGIGHVWAGGAGLSGSVHPTATLGATLAAPDNRFGSGGGGMRFFDADRDGVLDVIVPSAYFTAYGVSRAGALHLFRGGATLSGTPVPVATLTAPIPTAGDQLTNYGVLSLPPTPFQLVDVTGDGFEDLVVGAYLADVNGVADAGAIHVFDGTTLSGNVVSIATLERAAPFGLDKLGDSDSRTQDGFRTFDVTGDGIADVVAIAPNASAQRSGDQRGSLCVWQGGPGLRGVVSPAAEMVGESSGDGLGLANPAFQTGDTDGDGILDLVVAAEYADDLGERDVGLAYVVSGGPSLSGAIVPRSRLARRVPRRDDRLCGDDRTWFTYHVGGALLRVVDLDRDGRADVFGVALDADDGVVSDVGMVAWWPNGSDFLPGRGPLEVWPSPEFADGHFGE